MPLDAASRVISASSVAGGKIATVQRGGALAVSSPASFCTSPNEALSPFIFQLPTTRGVIADITTNSYGPWPLPLGALCPNPARTRGTLGIIALRRPEDP